MAAKTQAHKEADKRIKDLEAIVKRLEEANENLVNELTKARKETVRTNQSLIDHIEADNQAAFRTVEILVYNQKRKNTSRQYFGVAEGSGLKFVLDATGYVHADMVDASKC